MKTGKIGAIFLISILALAGIGAGYASWTDSITIDATIKTGTVKIDIVAYSETWAYKYLVDDSILYYGSELDPIPDDHIYVADAQAYKGTYHDVDMVFNNVFPYVELTADFIFHYVGSVPVKIKQATFTQVDGYDITEYLTYTFYEVTLVDGVYIWGNIIEQPVGYQMHYCDNVGVKVTLYIDHNDNTMQDQTYLFGGTIDVIQWNEFK